MRLRGEGEPSSKGHHRGDLHCVVGIRQHSLFLRQGNDLIIDMPISFAQAALGDEVEIPTLTKKPASIQIDPGIQYGDYVRLKGKGMPDIRNKKHGDLIVRFIVEIPKKLTEEQKKILRDFMKTEHRNNEYMPGASGFWDRIKAYFSGQAGNAHHGGKED
jgi:molecular chaperone DnaJ